MGNKSNVLVLSGSVYRAPFGTALPSDATVELDAAFVDAGFVGENGLTMTISKQQQKIRDWGKGVVRIIQTEHDVQFAWEYLELNANSAKAFFGDANVTVVGKLLTVKVNSKVVADASYVFEMNDGPVVVRAVVPAGAMASEGGEFSCNLDDPIRVPMRIEALVHTTGDNAYLYRLEP